MSTVQFPITVDGPSAWMRADLEEVTTWRRDLSADQVAEIEAAAAPFAEGAQDIGGLEKTDFALTTLAEDIDTWVDDLLNGYGLLHIRGLVAGPDNIRQAATIFFGLGLHMGVPRSQNGKGHVLGHVCDLGLSSDDPNVRIYQTTERQNYHTDSCDVAGLMCLKPAKRGGESGLVSSMAIYNEMRAQCPDLLAELLKPMYVDRRGEVTVDGLPYYQQPVYSWHEGYLSALYAPHYIRSAPRLAGVPALTRKQIVALDTFDALADDPRFNITFNLEAGDILFVHNHTVMHDRLAYEDWGPGEGRRHLLRLWLAVPGARPLPNHYKYRFGSVTVGDRGGIRVPGNALNAPLEPV